jgi:hypothetical protein
MYFVKNTQLILEFSFATPGTDAGIERDYFLSQVLCGLMKRAVSLLKPSKQ